MALRGSAWMQPPCVARGCRPQSACRGCALEAPPPRLTQTPLSACLMRSTNDRLIGAPATRAAADNAEFYARNGVPFVMGTTGGDRAKVAAAAEAAGVYAVASPQMGKQVRLLGGGGRCSWVCAAA